MFDVPKVSPADVINPVKEQPRRLRPAVLQTHGRPHRIASDTCSTALEENR